MHIEEAGLKYVGDVGKLFLVEEILGLVPSVRFSVSLMEKKSRGFPVEKIICDLISTIQISNFTEL